MSFIPGLGGGFIFDDRPNIQENGSIHVASLSLENIAYAAYSFQPGHGSRPLSMLSFAFDYWRSGGLNPEAFKSTNLLIHALTAFVLALLLRNLLLLARWSDQHAALAALVMSGYWAVHPIQVSSVLYVVQRMQMLSTLFMVLSLWSYLRARSALINNQASRLYWTLTGLFWVFAFASKEDAVMLPAYAMVLEVTVLRFRAAKQGTSNVLRKGYLWMMILAAMLYMFVLVPHYWSWENYPGRMFSTLDRLLTQGRVLALYMSQIILPLPSRLPFYYDSFAISRSALDPISTLPALVLIISSLFVSWRLRDIRPVFSCGVLLFFAGHFVTSNVIGLEMVFEHRNYFPLMGAALVVVDLFYYGLSRFRFRVAVVSLLLTGAFSALFGMTLSRSHVWGEPVRFAQYSLKISPTSERAWLSLGDVYAGLSDSNPGSPFLGMAIDVCQEGAERIDSAALLSNVVSYKTIRGDIRMEDWQKFHDILRRTPMTSQNRDLIWIMIRNAQRGIPMDENGMLQAIDIIANRASFSAREYFGLASYVFMETSQEEKALPYLMRGVEQSKEGDPLVEKVLSDLEFAGREDWVDALLEVGASKK